MAGIGPARPLPHQTFANGGSMNNTPGCFTLPSGNAMGLTPSVVGMSGVTSAADKKSQIAGGRKHPHEQSILEKKHGTYLTLQKEQMRKRAEGLKELGKKAAKQNVSGEVLTKFEAENKEYREALNKKRDRQRKARVSKINPLTGSALEVDYNSSDEDAAIEEEMKEERKSAKRRRKEAKALGLIPDSSSSSSDSDDEGPVRLSNFFNNGGGKKEAKDKSSKKDKKDKKDKKEKKSKKEKKEKKDKKDKKEKKSKKDKD